MQKTIFSILILVFLILSGIYVYGLFAKEEVPSNVEAHLRIGNQLWYCEVADTPKEQGQGLSDRRKLQDNSCMIFVFESKQQPSFWMKDMHFDLDMLWIQDRYILDITENVPAPANFDDTLELYSPDVPVNIVVEINAGQVQKYGIMEGQTATIDFF